MKTDMKPEHFHVLAATVFATRVGPVTSTMFDRWLLGRIQQGVAGPHSVLLWDGSAAAEGRTASHRDEKNRRVLFSWLWNPDLFWRGAHVWGDRGSGIWSRCSGGDIARE
jgi:hypothetical protein